VFAAARALGYDRSRESRGRRRGGSARLIDLVLSFFDDSWADEITAGARAAAAAAGYDLVLTQETDDPEDDWPMRIRARGSAGVLLGLIQPTARQLAVVAEGGMPVVVIEPRTDDGGRVPSVRTTDREGAAAAAAHLIAQGAERFAMIHGTPPYRYGRARMEGFEREIHRLSPGTPVARIRGDWSARGAYVALSEALPRLKTDGRRLGLFTGTDEMAVGAYAALARAGLRIPDDVLVVGFDDARGSRWMQPPLTTVHQPLREMAAAGVAMLLDIVARGPEAGRRVELPTRLAIRASTARGRLIDV
jgi:LacI family transcriptional regulator